MVQTVFQRLVLAVLLLAGAWPALADELVVFAAASLTDSLQKVTDAYTRSTRTQVKLSFASSSALAKQIENGAPADVLVSADQEWMDYVVAKGLIREDSRADLLGNRLVLIAPADSKVALKLAAGAPILAALGAKGRLATGEPTSVPAGKYAKAALTSLGLWTELEKRLAPAENVRVALSYVARGEAPLGIVYATDAAAEPRVRIVDVFAASTHEPISYPVALTRSARAPAAGYREFLQSAAAAAIFTGAGFTLTGARSSGMTRGCSGFAFDVSREMSLLSGKPAAIAGGASRSKAPALAVGKGYRVALVEQAKVSFVAAPGKQPTQASARAGILRLAPAPRRSTVRVSLDQPAWIDLLSEGRLLESTRHTGSRDCPQLHKSVEFMVDAGAPLTLQLSNSAAASLMVVVTWDAGTGQ